MTPAAARLVPISEAMAPVSSGSLGILIFIASEIMFFAGLISAFLILRAGSLSWPPPHQPRLPAGLTGLNTLVLLASGGTMYQALCAIRHDGHRMFVSRLLATAMLGGLFLSVQGAEWLRLMSFGLTARSSLYGGLFYTMVGAHALHVFGAMLALLVVLWRATGRFYSANDYRGVEACWLYWTFVVALWPVIYVLLYLV